MGRKSVPIEIPQEMPVVALKPPKRPLEIFIDPDVGSRVNIVSLSTVDELEKVIDEIVEVNMAGRNAINEEATKLEERIITDQKDKVQDLKTVSKTVIVEKKEELSASQKLLAEMMKMKEKKTQEEKREENGEEEKKMIQHHQYPARLTPDNWNDLLAVQKITMQSINALLNEGVRQVVRKEKELMGQHRKDRESIRSVAASI